MAPDRRYVPPPGKGVVRDAHFALRRLSPAEAPGSGHVHLVKLSPTRHARRTLCDRAVMRLGTSSQVWNNPCRECVAAALSIGVTVAGEGNALVNLQRIPLADS